MSDELMTEDQVEQPAMVLVQDENGVFHRAIPYPETPMGGEAGTVVAAVEPLEVIETVPADAELLASPTIDDATAEEMDAALDMIHATIPTPPANMMSPEELAEYDSETVRLVSSKESHVCQLEAELAAYKADMKQMKKSVEDAKEALRELIQNRDRQRGRKPAPTLFDAPAHATTTNRVALVDATDQVNAVDPLAELWREYPLTHDNWYLFGLTAKDVERLNSGETKNSGVHPITKLGDVTRFITPNPDSPAFTRTLKDFKGFGDAAYDRWLLAETQFWDWWNNRGGKEEFAAQRANELETAL